MKHNLKKLLSLALMSVLVFAFSATAVAASISAEQAKSIALKDAGYDVSEVENLVAKTDYDDGAKLYDVRFAVKSEDGSYLEYDYEIAASSGRVIERDVDRENSYVKSNAGNAVSVPSAAKQGVDIGQAEAKKAAVKFFGLSEAEVKFISVRQGYDDGVKVYDIEFCKPYEVKYSCEVIASSGSVIDVDKDLARGIFDKIELFFEVLIAQIFGRV